MPQHPKCNGVAQKDKPACATSNDHASSQRLQKTPTSPRQQVQHEQRTQKQQPFPKSQELGRRQQQHHPEPPKVRRASKSACNTAAAMQVYNHQVPNQLPGQTMHQPFQPPLSPFHHHMQHFAPVNSAGWFQNVVEAQQQQQQRPPNRFDQQEFSKMLQQRHHQQQMQTQRLLVRNSVLGSGSAHHPSKLAAGLSQVSPQNILAISDLRKSDVGFLWYVTDIYGNKRKLNAEDVIEFCPSCKTGPPIHWSNIRNKRVAQFAHELRCNRQSKGNCDYNSSRERAVKRKKRASQRATDSVQDAEKGSKAPNVPKPCPKETDDSLGTTSKGASSTGPESAQTALKSRSPRQSSSKRGADVISQSISFEGEPTKRGRASNSTPTVSNFSAEVSNGTVDCGGADVNTRPCSACRTLLSAAFSFCPHCGVKQRQLHGQESTRVSVNSPSTSTVQGQFLGNF